MRMRIPGNVHIMHIVANNDNESFLFLMQLAETYNCLFFEASSRAGKNCAKVFTMEPYSWYI